MNMNRNKTKAVEKAIVHDMRHFNRDGPDSFEDALARLRRGEIIKACHLPKRARGRVSVETKEIRTLTGRVLKRRRTVWEEDRT
jgi:hypothetical protein